MRGEFNAETEVAILKNNVMILQEQLAEANKRILELNKELIECKRSAKILDDLVKGRLEI
jgi:hypothetical protein